MNKEAHPIATPIEHSTHLLRAARMVRLATRSLHRGRADRAVRLALAARELAGLDARKENDADASQHRRNRLRA